MEGVNARVWEKRGGAKSKAQDLVVLSICSEKP